MSRILKLGDETEYGRIAAYFVGADLQRWYVLVRDGATSIRPASEIEPAEPEEGKTAAKEG